MLTYFLIFIFKIIENTLSTLRIIIIAQGNKTYGAVLQFIIALIWIYSASITLNNIQNDIFKALAFSLGSLIGSFIGSTIEEMIH